MGAGRVHIDFCERLFIFAFWQMGTEYEVAKSGFVGKFWRELLGHEKTIICSVE
jgi:hypothetical protein